MQEIYALVYQGSKMTDDVVSHLIAIVLGLVDEHGGELGLGTEWYVAYVQVLEGQVV